MTALNGRAIRGRGVDMLKRSWSLLAAFIVWEALVRTGILDARFFPAPSAVLITLLELFLSGEILVHIAASMQRVLLGFAVGSALGLLLGLAIGWSRAAEQIFDPLISVLYPIPKLALLPLVLIIFGIGETSKVAIVAIAVFFTVVINTAAGVKMIEPVLLDAARNFGARGTRLFLKVVIPASLPSIFTSFRLALGIGLVVIIAAEFVASNTGLGYMIWLAWGSLSTRRMYAGLIMIGVIGLLTTYLLQWLSGRLMPWEVIGEQRGPHQRRSRRALSWRPLHILRGVGASLFSYSREYLYELPSGVTVPEPEGPLQGVRFEWISQSNVARVRPWKGSLVSRQFQTNLNRGFIGVYALAQGAMVGFAWGALKDKRTAIFCSEFPIEVGDGITLTAEVHPEYMRRGIGLHLRYAILTRLRDLGASMGLQRICGTVLVQNTPVQKLIERQGSIRSEESILVRITPWIFIRRTWRLSEQARRLQGRGGKLSMRFKVPEILSDPLLERLFGRAFVAPRRSFQSTEEGIG